MSIVFVNMPFVSLKRPSLGLGTLKACLAREGLASRVEYATLDFAHQVGFREYTVVNAHPATSCLGEWVFGDALFPDYQPDHAAFFATLGPIKAGCESADQMAEFLWPVRRQAAAFVDRLARKLVGERARIVGCTSTFQQNVGSLALLKRIRELDPTIITMMGGANCEGPMGLALVRRFAFLDFVVSGEADELIVPLCRALLEEGRTAQVPYGVLHAGVQVPPGSPPRASLRDMRALPMPDFDDYFAAVERLGLRDCLEPSLPVETSRGCWWGQKHHCTFCGLNGHGMSYRAKTPEQAVEQFHTLAQRHGTRQFMVADNILDNGYFKTVLPALAQADRGYEIFYETKANLKRDQIALLARAGVGWIQPGLESLSDELLQLMDKGTTALQNLQTLKWAREFGVSVTWLLLFAFPGDRVEWYREMAELAPKLVHLQPPNGLIRVGFHRFSPYFERSAEYQIAPVPEPGYAYVYPFGEGNAELAYFFLDQGDSQNVGELVEALVGPFGDWMQRFWNDRPILTLEDDGDTCEVLDTRYGWMLRYSHRGLARQLLLQCEQVRSWSSLLRTLEVEPQVLEEALAPLLKQGLIVRQGDHLLGLAVGGDRPTVLRGIPEGRFSSIPWQTVGSQA